MTVWIRVLATSVLLVGLSACSSDDGSGTTGPLRCPEGTVSSGDECVPTRGDAGGRDAAPADGGDEDSGADDTGATTDSGGGTDAGAGDTGGGEDASTGPCIDGAVQCSAAGIPQTCVGGRWIDGEPCLPGFSCLGGRCVEGAGCRPGDVRGCFDEENLYVCNAGGTSYEAQPCTDDLGGPLCFEGECGFQRCAPGDTRCADDDYTIEICDETGQLWLEGEVCDRLEGRVCAGGECVSGCVAAAKDPTYIGCEYWSVDLPQYEDPTTAGPEIPHAVVISNVGEFDATVSVETMASVTPPADTIVPRGEAVAIEFPRLDVAGTQASNHSFRITSTEPVIAYQFNPFNNVNLFSNDASLLLPSNAIGREYRVLGWPGGGTDPFFGFEPQTGWFTVVATARGTTNVDITFSTDVLDGDFTGITAGSTHRFEMEQFDVLNFECATTLLPPTIRDLTGSHVVADRPIVVFAGHEQAVIGEEGDDGNCCADHMEQQLFPVATWGNRYLAVHSPPRGTEPDFWRVLASEDGTRIVTTPSIPDLDGVTLNAGEFAEASTTESFEIEATRPVLVGQYLVSQQARGTTRTVGDPAFILAVPVEQLRLDYQVLTPDDYGEDYITVIKPVGSTVSRNGSPITEAFTPFGTLTWEYAHVSVLPGVSRLAGDQPFAVAMYGYDSAVSYGYPGGLNLGDLAEPVDDL